MKLGVFTVSIPEWEPLEALERLAAMGYDGVEWRVTEDTGDRAAPSFWSGNRCGMSAAEAIERADELKAKAAAVGMETPSLGTYATTDDMPAVEQNMRAAAAIGAANLRVNTPRFDPAAGSYARQVESFRDRFAEVAELAAGYNVRAVIETHMGQLAPSMTKARAILDGLDPAHVGIMWDVGNQVVEGGERPEMAVDIAGEYLAEIHVKNLAYFVDEETDVRTVWKCRSVPVDKGLVDWPAVVEILTGAGYDGWLMFEDFSTDLPMVERLEHNLRWFRRLLG